MEILNIRIQGFRNISSSEVRLGKTTAFIALNGYGKSNLIDAIGFGFEFMRVPPPIKDLMMRAKSNIPLLKTNAAQDFCFEFEAKIEIGDQTHFARYGYGFCWGTDNTCAKIKEEHLKIKEGGKGQRFVSFVQRNQNEATYKTSKTGRCDKPILTEGSSLLINKLLALDNLYYIQSVRELNRLEFFIERHLDASSSYIPTPFVIKGFEELELNSINSIPRAIYYLKKEHREHYDILMNAFKQLFPNIIDVDVRELRIDKPQVPQDVDMPLAFTDSVYYLNVVDRRLSQPLSFERLSNGTKRVFLMLTLATIADIRNLPIIAIEEPENSIHPKLLGHFLDMLHQFTNNCKIILTSHSPHLVQYLDPLSLYIGLESETSTADFKKIMPSKINALYRDAEMCDDSLGDFIFDSLSSADGTKNLNEYFQ